MGRSQLYPPSVTPGIPKLGEKPTGWIETTFGDVLSTVKRPAQINDDDEYQLVTAKRSRGGIVPRERLRGRGILTKTQFYIKSGDFVISKRQIIHGACGVAPATLDGAIVSGEYSVLRVKKGLMLEYLNYLTHTVYFQQTCFQSSVGVDVEKMIFDLKEWLRFKVYLPPVDEQRKIVEILSSWDHAIALTGQLIAAKQQLKKGLMQLLLTGKVRFPEFRNRWIPIKISELIEDTISGDWGDTPDDSSNTMAILRSTNFSGDGKIDPSKLAYRKILEHKIPRLLLKRGDILLEKSGGGPDQPVGRVAYFDLPGEFGYANFLARLKIKTAFHSKAVFYFLLNYYASGRILRFQQQTTGIRNFQLTEFLKEKIEFPHEYNEQKRLADILSLCDQEIGLIKQKLVLFQQQKKGLMQQLLTGKVRVKV